jgi:hypothetical protein
VTQHQFPRADREKGFALIMCLFLMPLFVLLALSMLSISSIELRKTRTGEAKSVAQANARLALMQAIGQLQKTMGPDQRVSATAEILSDNLPNPHWTGTWRTTLPNGDSFFVRDDLSGGLRDRRWEDGLNTKGQVIEWLVSGAGNPAATNADAVSLFQLDNQPTVTAPKVRVDKHSGSFGGHMAWWTGDLGVRANLRASDPRSTILAKPENLTNGGMYRVMASQAADMKMMSGGTDLADSARPKLATSGTIDLTGVDLNWGKQHAFDFTTDSQGVLVDVAKGGLKQDLTSYFLSGAIAPLGNLPGLADNESLVGDLVQSRHAQAGPRFGLLRDWARLGIPFSGKNVRGRQPQFNSNVAAVSREKALANEQPVKLAGNQRAALQPILVEATNFTQMSCYINQEDNAGKKYQLRQLMYPRVVLWNPYNADITFGRSIVMIQGNGRQEMWTLNTHGNNPFMSLAQWLSFEGGRSTQFFGPGGILDSEGYNDPYMGSYYFSIPETKFGPGECLVFSPARSAEYDGLSAYRTGSYDLAANVLSCTVSPDPGRSFYVSGTEIDGGFSFLPIQFWYAPTPYWSSDGRNGVENQSDDTRVIMKEIGSRRRVTFEVFDALPQVAVISASLQYGAGREPRIQWAKEERMPIQLLSKTAPTPTVIPNVRTREGIRLRWFDEHPSNLGSGSLANTAYFDEALLANWNLRASFVMRSPWENIGGGAPWFFGAYTRDLFDQAVSWDEQAPVPRSGRFHGNPFGPPQEGFSQYILFDVPRSETGLLSLGQLQHAKLSEMIWHPSYAMGNSLVDPRLGTSGLLGLNRTSAKTTNNASANFGGFSSVELGWSNDTQRSADQEEWAKNARSILTEVPQKDHLVYDLSFELNQKLWDRFYLSSGSIEEKRLFAENPQNNPLPNARMQLAPGTEKSQRQGDLTNFHKSASQLMVHGAFNVNSTRVDAWKAMLGSTRLSGFGNGAGAPFPRILAPKEGAWNNDGIGDRVWAGYRELNEDEVNRLAIAIVAEVKKRGPFLSLADFVNRRLAEDETGRMGPLQAAIENAGLNSSLVDGYPLDNETSLPDYEHPDNIPDATRMEQTLKPESKVWGATTYLTQADILQVLGPTLTARSDSFVIRAYGDAVDSAGKLQARAWCEAVVQRTPEAIFPDATGLNSAQLGLPGDFGRRFRIQSFRWLSPNEI